MNNTARINLGSDWNLHGAASTAQLNVILNDLHDRAERGSCDYSATATRVGVARDVVVEVSAWYQSLWMVG